MVNITPMLKETELKCNCIYMYRKTIRLRRAVLARYLSQGSFSYAELVGLITMLETSVEQTLSKLPGQTRDDLWGKWANLKPILNSRPPSDTTYVLTLDALFLSLSPNAYLHLLKDALYLRLCYINTEYKTNLERQIAISKSVKWAETNCKRVWKRITEIEPERPKHDWWQRVAKMKTPLRFRPEIKITK